MDLRAPALDLRAATSLGVEDSSQVAAARRVATELARRLGFDATLTGRLALVATEAATNLLKHAGRGEILIASPAAGGPPLAELLALDRGPGMADVERCVRDGYSTAGSPGTGLGAMRRLAGTLEVYSRRERGTALLARLGPVSTATSPAGSVVVGGLSVARQGEVECGDAWDVERDGSVLSVLVADGLGHGPDAARTAVACVRAFRQHPRVSPARRLEALHAALRGTRGAAVAVAEIDPGRRVVRFAGLGNVAAAVVSDPPVRHLVSHHGTAGHFARTIREYTYPWPAGGVLIMHSDGLASVRDLGAYPGLLARDPALVAGVLYRDLARRRDDTTVVVARELTA
jgi:anti-sigma regulatory factor (Ser/Thr protein kinase)